MATTLQEIAELLFEAEYKFDIRNDRNEIWLLIGPLKNYREKNGDDSLVIILRVSDKGEHLDIYAPLSLYISEDPEKSALFFKACSIIQWKTKLVQFEYDDADGEIRLMVDLPVMDSTVTLKQLLRCIRGLFSVADAFYPILDNVLKNGILDFDPLEKKDDLDRILEEINNLTDENLEELL